MSSKKGFWGIDLDTLGQKGTDQLPPVGKECLLVGEGSCKASIKKRPKKKFITQKLCYALIDVALENNESDWAKKYWNTWHCQNYITTYEGKGYGYYCKNRFCSICVGIRKAEIINKLSLIHI